MFFEAVKHLVLLGLCLFAIVGIASSIPDRWLEPLIAQEPPQINKENE